MVATPGWTLLEAWIHEQCRIELEAMEKGLRSWDDYQRAVGRIDGMRRVLEWPGEVITRAEQYKSQGGEYE